MIYNKPLPAIRELIDLANNAVFPVTLHDLLDLAAEIGSSPEVTDFLSLFQPAATFASRVDFLTRSEELELLLSQERTMPPERLHSPQG